MVDLGNLMGAFKFVSEVEKIQWRYQKKKAEAEEKGEEFTKTPLVPVLGCEFYISERPEQNNLPKMIQTEEQYGSFGEKFSRI